MTISDMIGPSSRQGGIATARAECFASSLSNFRLLRFGHLFLPKQFGLKVIILRAPSGGAMGPSFLSRSRGFRLAAFGWIGRSIQSKCSADHPAKDAFDLSYQRASQRVIEGVSSLQQNGTHFSGGRSFSDSSRFAHSARGSQ
jgi:hypothetical protein